MLTSNLLEGLVAPANDTLPDITVVVFQGIGLVIDEWLNGVQQSHLGAESPGPGCRRSNSL